MSAPTFSARWALLWCLALWLTGCTDPYMPDVVTSPPGYLVVDGFVNSQGITTIKLSRTYAIASPLGPPPETKATVYVEEENGPRYPLREIAAGTYVSTSLTLNAAKKHRLHFLTLSGKEFASDFVPVRTTPAIDTVAWRTTDAGLTVYVNSHDATSATRYYRWEYDETWEIVPPFIPGVEYVSNRIRPIVVPYPAVCWVTTHSNAVEISKTTALSQDVVSDYPLRKLPPTSDRLNRKYSILVQQHAITKEEYDYWEQLRKNTERIGTLFDPQPSQLTGNVHSLTNDADLALGYVGVNSLVEKRIFISRPQLPAAWRPLTGYESCIPPDTVKLPDVDVTFRYGYLFPIYAISKGGALVGYIASKADCIDCRKRGTAVKPSFWQ